MTDQPTTDPGTQIPAAPSFVTGSEQAPEMTPPPGTRGSWLAANKRIVIVAAAIVVVVVVAIISFSMSSDSTSSPTTAAPAQGAVSDLKVGPLTADQLKAEVAKLGGLKVYWGGPVQGFTYMLTVQGGQATVGYLPEGQPEAAVAANLQIGSYPVADAYTVTSEAGKEANSAAEKNANGSVISYNKGRMTNIYLAFPNVDVQVEVFNPNPGEALVWAKSGKVQPIN